MIRTHVLKDLPEAREGEREKSKGDVRGGATARDAMKKSRYVRVIEGEKVRGDIQSNAFSPQRSEVLFES